MAFSWLQISDLHFLTTAKDDSIRIMRLEYGITQRQQYINSCCVVLFSVYGSVNETENLFKSLLSQNKPKCF